MYAGMKALNPKMTLPPPSQHITYVTEQWWKLSEVCITRAHAHTDHRLHLRMCTPCLCTVPTCPRNPPRTRTCFLSLSLSLSLLRVASCVRPYCLWLVWRVRRTRHPMAITMRACCDLYLVGCDYVFQCTPDWVGPGPWALEHDDRACRESSGIRSETHQKQTPKAIQRVQGRHVSSCEWHLFHIIVEQVLAVVRDQFCCTPCASVPVRLPGCAYTRTCAF